MQRRVIDERIVNRLLFALVAVLLFVTSNESLERLLCGRYFLLFLKIKSFFSIIRAYRGFFLQVLIHLWKSFLALEFSCCYFSLFCRDIFVVLICGKSDIVLVFLM